MPFTLLDSIPKKIKGIEYSDSIFVGFITTIDPEVIDELFKNKKITNDQYKNTATKIYCLTGVNNGKQFYKIDRNQNEDFGDDQLIVFDKKTTFKTNSNLNINDSFPAVKINVNKIENDKIFQDEIIVNFFPNANYFTYKEETEEQKFKHSLQIIAQFNDYLYGSFSLYDKKYKVAIDKYNWSGPQFIIGEKDSLYNNDYHSRYSVHDTIKISDWYYKINSIDLISLRLVLKPISINEKVYGFRTGYTMKNFDIYDLNNHKSNIKNLFKGKNLLLLDFWGTWCGPCKELTPELINLNKKYNAKLSLASLAYEQDATPVIEYVTANNMNWYNGIIKGIPKSAKPEAKIIKELRVICFPTFILLDQDLNIVYRTCGGGTNFKKMLDFIDKY